MCAGKLYTLKSWRTSVNFIPFTERRFHGAFEFSSSKAFVAFL
jgi:hypothetical protein